jgi:hypothetical protein
MPAAPAISVARTPRTSPTTPEKSAASGTGAEVMKRAAPMTRPRTWSAVRSWNRLWYPTEKIMKPIPKHASPAVMNTEASTTGPEAVARSNPPRARMSWP